MNSPLHKRVVPSGRCVCVRIHSAFRYFSLWFSSTFHFAIHRAKSQFRWSRRSKLICIYTHIDIHVCKTINRSHAHRTHRQRKHPRHRQTSHTNTKRERETAQRSMFVNKPQETRWPERTVRLCIYSYPVVCHVFNKSSALPVSLFTGRNHGFFGTGDRR